MSFATFFGVSRINIAIALLIQKVESKDGGSSHWQNEFKTRMWMAAWPIEATRWSSRFLSPSISDAEPKSSPVKRDWTPSIFSPDPMLHPTHFRCVVVGIRVRWAGVECDLGWTTNVHVRCHYSKLWTTNITYIAVRDEDGSLKNSFKTYLVVDREASEGPLLTT